MQQIFVNLKRFDVSRTMGGVCPSDQPAQWIQWVMRECVHLGLGILKDQQVAFCLPESLIVPATEALAAFPQEQTASLYLGCQGVFREDIVKGGNFGAFSTNRPASAMRSLGCEWAMIGHSEERKDKTGMLAMYDPAVLDAAEPAERARRTVDKMLAQEVQCALRQGMRVLFCMGETAEEKGTGTEEEQRTRVEAVLKAQLQHGLKGLDSTVSAEHVVIGYEPVWAIGPGKTPPGAAYIAFVSAYIRETALALYGFRPVVVYGGGLKEENAAMIASVPTVGGGLVALTRFTGDIGFYPDELARIISRYAQEVMV